MSKRRTAARLTGSLVTIAGALLLSQFAFAAAPLRLAVASNFAAAAAALERAFEDRHPGRVDLSAGSTGKLYAQIRNGAPFDILLAADTERPRRLEASGFAVPGSRFTYAVGRLAVWSRDPGLRGVDCRDALVQGKPSRIAIANPRTAPYGEAARETLVALGLWQALEPRLVYGENIAQALQFVASGNAALGFVAAAQLGDAALPPASCRWDVPAELHAPLEQQAVLLQRAADNAVARAFLDFLAGDEARAVIRQFGYGIAGSG